MTKLEKLFGNATQVKIMRLFIFNPNTTFASSDLSKMTKARSSSVRKVMNVLEKIDFVDKKKVTRKTTTTRGRGKKKKKVTRKRKVVAWTLNEDFAYLSPLRDLLMPTDKVTHKEVEKKITPTGRIKLVLLSGVFIYEPEARVDLLVVGDKIESKKIRQAVSDIEARVGAKLSYAVMDTDEFKYRHGVNDKLIRDIFDFKHEKILNKLDV